MTDTPDNNAQSMLALVGSDETLAKRLEAIDGVEVQRCHELSDYLSLAREWVFDAHQLILGFTGQVPLTDDIIMLGSEFGRAWLEVKVIPLY